MIKVEPVPAFRDNYIWMIIHEPSNKVIIVDPGDASPVIDAIREYRLMPAAIIITHHHPDHVGGINEILNQYPVPVYGPAKENIPGRTHALQEGDVFDLPELGLRFNILDMPGHTSGAIAYYAEGMVFVGDTLFLSGCGRLFEGTPAQMHASLSKLASLPDNTKIYCAHEYTLANLNFARAVEPGNADIERRLTECKALRDMKVPTVPGHIALEKLVNPFLRVHEDAVIQAACAHTGQTLSDEIEVLAVIRKWKDNF